MLTFLIFFFKKEGSNLDRGHVLKLLRENLKKSIESKNRFQFMGRDYIYAHRHDHIEYESKDGLAVVEAMDNGVYAFYEIENHEKEKMGERPIHHGAIDNFIENALDNSRDLSDKELFDAGFILASEKYITDQLN
jgi:hypothetical protein